jgi:hypothetical protein
MALPFVIVGSAAQPCVTPNEGKVSGHLNEPWCKMGIAKAAITIKGAKLKRKLKSDAYGNFEFCVPPGNYTVTVEKYGFKRYLVDNLKVTSGETSPVNLDMEAGWATSDPNLGKRAPCVAPPNKSLDASGGSVFRN